jgi:hypothetical protein
MNDSTSVEWLSKAIGQAAKSSKFCVVGCLPVGNPGIEVEGLGAITLPLKVPSSRLSLLKCLQAALPTKLADMWLGHDAIGDARANASTNREP